MAEKKPKQDDRTPFQMEKNNNARAALRVLLALYLAYVIWQLIKGYLAGDLGMPLPAFYAALVFFIAAEIAILAFALRRWKQGRERVEQAWQEQPPEEPADDSEDTEDAP